MDLLKTKMQAFWGKNGAIEYALMASLIVILAVMVLTRVG
jgi:hypothetical protein